MTNAAAKNVNLGLILLAMKRAVPRYAIIRFNLRYVRPMKQVTKSDYTIIRADLFS